MDSTQQIVLPELPQALQQLRSAIAASPMMAVKANLRNTIQAWAERLPKHDFPKPTPAAPRKKAFRMRRSVSGLPAGVLSSPVARMGMAAMIPGDSAAEMVITSSLYNFLNIYNTLIIVRLVLTWFPNPPQAIAGPLSTLCDPYLNLFRGLIPPIGGTLDLSPILAFIVLNTFQGTAAALPCEMPAPGANPRLRPTPKDAALKWAKRQEMTFRRKMGLPMEEAQEA